MTWLPSLVTLVLFVLGIVFYRWQKSVDRETELLSERRQKYDAYIASRHHAYAVFSDRSTKAFAKELIEYFVCRDRLMLQAPEDVMNALSAHALAFERLRRDMLAIEDGSGSTTEEEFRQIVKNEADTLYPALGAFRRDLGNHSRIMVDLPKLVIAKRFTE